MSRRKNRKLSRQAPKREAYDMVLIVCEGTETEPNYFKGLRTFEKLSSVNVEVISGERSAATFVVNTAIQMKNNQEEEMPYDKIYCVIDGDVPHHLSEANKLAKQYGVEMIISYPCIEYWYLCHFKFSRSPIEKTGNRSVGDNCEYLLNIEWDKEFREQYKKNLSNVYQKLYSKLDIAIKNAKTALKQAQQEKEFNPSTQVHELVSYLRKIKQIGLN